MRNNIDKKSADACLQVAFQKESPSHLYPTRAKVSRAAPTVQQLEATQTKEHGSPIFNFDQYGIHNPLNELKHKELIKSED